MKKEEMDKPNWQEVYARNIEKYANERIKREAHLKFKADLLENGLSCVCGMPNDTLTPKDDWRVCRRIEEITDAPLNAKALNEAKKEMHELYLAIQRKKDKEFILPS